MPHGAASKVELFRSSWLKPELNRWLVLAQAACKPSTQLSSQLIDWLTCMAGWPDDAEVEMVGAKVVVVSLSAQGKLSVGLVNSS